MRVKELIALLQTCEQEAYIHGVGGAISGVKLVPGYWDGPFRYMDGDVLVVSTQGEKLVLETTNEDSIVMRYHGDLEEVKRHLRFDTEYPAWKDIEESCEETRERERASLTVWTDKVLTRYECGDKAAQKLEDPVGRYCVWWWETPGKVERESLCIGECDAIIKSGKFIPVRDEDVLLWELK